MSEHFLKSWLDDSSLVKLGKCVLQKAEAVLSHKLWDWTHIFLILVTSLICEQFSKSWSDHLSLAKWGKHVFPTYVFHSTLLNNLINMSCHLYWVERLLLLGVASDKKIEERSDRLSWQWNRDCQGGGRWQGGGRQGEEWPQVGRVQGEQDGVGG